jgi:hypothetical protein
MQLLLKLAADLVVIHVMLIRSQVEFKGYRVTDASTKFS